MRKTALLLLACALAGCSLEPRYARPQAEIPPSWPVGDAYLRQSEAGLPAVSYRDVFRDPRLQAIIEQALARNQDLRIALANVEAARGLYRVQRAPLLPELDASGRASVSGGGAGSGGGGTRQNYSIDLGVSAFELDLFGRVRSLSHAALNQYFATEAAVRATRLTIVAEVADAYLTLAEDRSLLAIAADTEASALKSYQLTGARLRGGISPRTELRQAETVLAQARADRANQTTLVAQDRNALELLAGGPVRDDLLPPSIESVDGLLAELPAGLDSTILLRRPDVVEAEYRLRSASAQIGAARAAFFPRISLTGLAGLASSALGSLFSGSAFNFSIAPSVSLPIFDNGSRAGNLAYARAQREVALAQYERAIQTAFREVADALARRGTIGRQAAAQQELEGAARDRLALETARYRAGIDPYLNTLDAQRTLYAARRSLAQVRLLRATNLVALYRTLGGDELIEAPAAGPPARPRPLSASPR
jgi:multidrug efflux system outer membrane protein